MKRRLSIYNWNPGPRRGKEDAFEKQIVVKWYIVTVVIRSLPCECACTYSAHKSSCVVTFAFCLTSVVTAISVSIRLQKQVFVIQSRLHPTSWWRSRVDPWLELDTSDSSIPETMRDDETGVALYQRADDDVDDFATSSSGNGHIIDTPFSFS